MCSKRGSLSFTDRATPSAAGPASRGSTPKLESSPPGFYHGRRRGPNLEAPSFPAGRCVVRVWRCRGSGLVCRAGRRPNDVDGRTFRLHVCSYPDGLLGSPRNAPGQRLWYRHPSATAVSCREAKKLGGDRNRAQHRLPASSMACHDFLAVVGPTAIQARSLRPRDRSADPLFRQMVVPTHTLRAMRGRIAMP